MCRALVGHETRQPAWVDAPRSGFCPGEPPRPWGGSAALVTGEAPGLRRQIHGGQGCASDRGLGFEVCGI